MSATLPALNREVMQLRQHIAWLHGTLSKLGDVQPIVSTIDPPRELMARVDYARAALANSLRRCAELGVQDRPPSLAALVVGQALAQPPEEMDARRQHAALADRRVWAVAWCTFDGRIDVSWQVPNDEVGLASGDAYALWHWIEDLAVRGTGVDAGHYMVPGITPDAGLDVRFQAAQRFGRILVDAGRSIWPFSSHGGTSCGRTVA